MTDTERPDLRRKPADDPEEARAALNERLRAAFIEGAEEQSLRQRGRGLSDDELREMLRDYPGDLQGGSTGAVLTYHESRR